jgi:uncharacterized protein (DUF1697 family)
MAGRYVALIRGINVGPAKRVAMADLKALVAGFGYSDVRTLLNSGNVVFSCKATPEAAGDRLHKAMAAELRVSARVIVVTADEVARMIRENPFRDIADNPSRLLLSILASPADRRRLTPLLKQKWGTEGFALGSRVAYIWCPDGILASKLPEAVSKALGDAVTSRNWATMIKIHALLQGAEKGAG